MKKTFFPLLVAAFFAQFSVYAQNATLSVEIDGWGNDTVNLVLDGGDILLPIENGKFTWSIPQQDTLDLIIYRTKDMMSPSQTKMIHLTRITPADRLQIKGAVTDKGGLSYRVEGSELNDDIATVFGSLAQLWLESEHLRKKMAAAGTLPNEEVAKLNDAMYQNYSRTTGRMLEWVLRNPTRESAAFFLLLQPVDTLGVYYPMLDEAVKNGLFRKELRQGYAKAEARLKQQQTHTARFLGQPAPDFTLTTIDGKPFTLSGFDNGGKYIVLDFWGSWCGPCIAGMPAMKAYYEKHRDRLEIVGIACNDREANWKKAVAENALPWLQVINDTSAAENNAPLRYGVRAYPTFIVLGPDKTVCLVSEGGGMDFYMRLDELLNK